MKKIYSIFYYSSETQISPHIMTIKATIERVKNIVVYLKRRGFLKVSYRTEKRKEFIEMLED